MAHSRSSRFEQGLLLAFATAFAAWAGAFIRHSSVVAIDGKRYFCLFDDAMISMRYAWNLSHGLGLVWNPGEYVEGYTNLLLTLVMALPTRLLDKPHAVLAVQILGLGMMLGVAWLARRLADDIVSERGPLGRALARVLVFVGVLTYYPLAYWSLMGMETALLSGLLLAGLLEGFGHLRQPTRARQVRMSVWLGLALLTRNDSVLLAALIFLYVWREGRQARLAGPARAELAIAVGVYALFGVAQTAFRLFYYGEWLPNTYVLKLTGLPLAARIRDGWVFVGPFLKELSPVLAVVALDVISNVSRRKLLLASLVLTSIAYQVWIGGDAWDYWRMLCPSVPLLLVLGVEAVLGLVDALAETSLFRGYLLRNPILPRQQMAAVLALAVAALGVGEVNRRFLAQVFFRKPPFRVSDNRRNVNLAVALEQVTAADASLAVFWAGTIPYYTGRTAIDILGKCDKHVARLAPDTSGKVGWNGMRSVPGHNKYDLDYSIRSRRPTYAQGFTWGTQNIKEWARSHYVRVAYRGVILYLLREPRLSHPEAPAVPGDELS